MKKEVKVAILAITLSLLCTSINTVLAESKKPSPLVQQSINLYEQCKYNEAIAPLQKYLEKDPKNTNALILMGIIQGSNGNPNKAIEYFHSVLKITPNDWKPYSLMANTYRAQGQHSDAIKYYKQGLKIKNIDEKTRNYLSSLLNDTINEQKSKQKK